MSVNEAGEKKPTITVVVPALDEEGNIEAAVADVRRALDGRFSDYEIIVFDDGSTDSTPRIIDRLAEEDSRVRAVHNDGNRGLGYCYTEGVRLASMEYVVLIPGDNEIPAAAMERIFDAVGKADIVVPYTANPSVRPLPRRIVSRLFVIILNTLFGMDLRYYNGTCVHKTSIVKHVPMSTMGFAYMASILVRELKAGASFTEVGVHIKQRDTGATKAFAPANVISVARTIAELFYDVRIKNRHKYNKPLRRVTA